MRAMLGCGSTGSAQACCLRRDTEGLIKRVKGAKLAVVAQAREQGPLVMLTCSQTEIVRSEVVMSAVCCCWYHCVFMFVVADGAAAAAAFAAGC